MVNDRADGPTPVAASTAAFHRAVDTQEVGRLVTEALRSWCGDDVAVLEVDVRTDVWDLAPVAGWDEVEQAELRATLGALVTAAGLVREPVETDHVTVVPVTSPAGVVVAYGLRGAGRGSDPCREAVSGIADHHGAALARMQSIRALQRRLEHTEESLGQHRAVSAALQRALLPPKLPLVDDLLVGSTYRPLTDEVGGDFYDLFPLPDRSWGLVLGDVCGKGPTAASITALTRNAMRTALLNTQDLEGAVGVLNRLLIVERQGEQSALCSIVVGRIDVVGDTVELELAVAGHPSPVVLRAHGAVEEVGQTGPILGIWDEIEVSTTRLTFGPGDSCIFYTDGATDVTDARGDLFGDERLLDVIEGCRGMHPEAIAKTVERAVVDFQRGVARDDLAVLVVAAPLR